MASSSAAKQGRPSDATRILRILMEADGSTNSRLKTETELSDDRYNKVKKELLDQGYIEQYRCRGGGIKITNNGEKSLNTQKDNYKSIVSGEKDLYEPFSKIIKKQIFEDGSNSICIETSNLKKKGKWSNPDFTQISKESYKFLRKSDIIVSTYEIKQFPSFDSGSVFEAAAHLRFSHESTLVLEWPKELVFNLSDRAYRIDEIATECQRHRVGLAIMKPYHNSFRLHTHVESYRTNPQDADIESWLEYIIERLSDSKRKEIESFFDVQ